MISRRRKDVPSKEKETYMITIVNYGVGNLASVKNMLKKAGFESVLASDVDTIEKA